MVLAPIFTFLAMSHFPSAQVPRGEKYEITKNVKIGANTIKKTKFGTKNVSKIVYSPSKSFFRPNILILNFL